SLFFPTASSSGLVGSSKFHSTARYSSHTELCACDCRVVNIKKRKIFFICVKLGDKRSIQFLPGSRFSLIGQRANGFGCLKLRNGYSPPPNFKHPEMTLFVFIRIEDRSRNIAVLISLFCLIIVIGGHHIAARKHHGTGITNIPVPPILAS